jgi:hypothetical protein
VVVALSSSVVPPGTSRAATRQLCIHAEQVSIHELARAACGPQASGPAASSSITWSISSENGTTRLSEGVAPSLDSPLKLDGGLFRQRHPGVFRGGVLDLLRGGRTRHAAEADPVVERILVDPPALGRAALRAAVVAATAAAGSGEQAQGDGQATRESVRLAVMMPSFHRRDRSIGGPLREQPPFHGVAGDASHVRPRFADREALASSRRPSARVDCG